MYIIDYHSYRSLKSYDSRVRFLIMHYTSQNFITSVATLTDSVSAHYLVPDPTERSYIEAGFNEIRVFNMVDENARAWHAGVSVWDKVNNLNFSSIGIEIVYEETESNGVLSFPPYNEQQIAAVQSLALNIIQRHPEMTPANVLAHSDIAPYRKIDPGPAFPWKKLYEAGVGAWYDDETKQRYIKNTDIPTKKNFLSKLEKYGYDTSSANYDDNFITLVRVFQLHFRHENYDGVLDKETDAIISALNEKYKS